MHNVWVAGDTLYIGAYNAGFRAFDISGELRGDLQAQGREIAQLQHRGTEGKIPNAPMTWGAVVKNNLMCVNDLNSGLFDLAAGAAAGRISRRRFRGGARSRSGSALALGWAVGAGRAGAARARLLRPGWPPRPWTSLQAPPVRAGRARDRAHPHGRHPADRPGRAAWRRCGARRRSLFVSTGHGTPIGSPGSTRHRDDRLEGRVELGLFPATLEVSPDGYLAYVVNFNLHGDMVPSSRVGRARPRTCSRSRACRRAGCRTDRGSSRRARSTTRPA